MPIAIEMRRVRNLRLAPKSVVDAVCAWLPEGRKIPEDIWRTRHNLITRFALLQAVALGLFGLARGYDPTTRALDVFVMGAPAVLARLQSASRRLRTVSATMSFMCASMAVRRSRARHCGRTHFAVMPEHFRESPLYGWYFLLAGTTQVVVAIVLGVRPSAWTLRGALVGSALIAPLWLETRVIGVPLGPGRGETEPVGALDMLATGAELATCGCAWAALRMRMRSPAEPARQAASS